MCARSAHNFARLKPKETTTHLLPPSFLFVSVLLVQKIKKIKKRGKFKWQCKSGSRIANRDFPAKQRSGASHKKQKLQKLRRRPAEKKKTKTRGVCQRGAQMNEMSECE
ncbi:uncharacterized protein Dyak_GE28023 [Drosophila yakuba]|uniref:Uncharacterized protein n=1 Tax=Drosophila yakuba TaxID=7245 RepID=A0A0R1DVY9_DROYA|nr:uncharacterized protein Dyak_GE28023 [Drosophila yakuba]